MTNLPVAGGRRAPVLLFSSTLFVSAFLLFSVQPMFAKMALPLLGGTPAVWNTCMVFFQAVLLAGYAYAHLTTGWIGVRRQAVLHLCLLVLPLATLPIIVPKHWVPPLQANPIPWLLGLLLVAVGLPFFVISTSAPLLQKWFANTGHPSARDPYFLYAASNLGSLLALLAYPVALEPSFRLVEQSRLWTIGYGVFMALTALCALYLWRSRQTSAQVSDPHQSLRTEPIALATSGLTASRRIWWVLLAFVPSSLLLGVTAYLSTDVAAIPLLWVVPLAIYLLTFILVFAKRAFLPHNLMVGALPVVILPLIVLLICGGHRPVWFVIPLHLLTFFIASMVCHGELSSDRPSTEHLTEFYFWLSVGGVLGGIFNALVAPLLFDTVMEYPIAMVLACLLRPGRTDSSTPWRLQPLDYAMPLALGAMVAGTALALRVTDVPFVWLRLALLCGPPALVCYSFRYRPVRFGLGIGAFLFVALLFTSGWERALHVERSFFGVYRIGFRPDGYHDLMSGTTLHGMQSLDPSRRREPLTYFYRTGPLGQVFDSFAGETPRLRHVAVIGLGTGTMSCYASPGQEWTFYEIDPTVQRLASNPRYFTFLRDCLERVHIVLGDARLSLTRATDGHYDLIAIDAFSSDAIPVHLLTQEALELYLSKLATGGLITFHISNRYLRLEPVLANLATRRGLVAAYRSDLTLTSEEAALGKTMSIWVVLARQEGDLGSLAGHPQWRRLQGRPDAKVWTDDFSNLLSVFRLK